MLITACDTVKRVPANRHLLTNNEIAVNGEDRNDALLEDQLYQKPNSSILGFRLRLHLFNLAKPKPDSSFRAKFINKPGKYERMAKILSKKQVNRLGKSFYYYGIHNFLKKSGEPPVLVEEASTKKSAARLRSYYFNNGYFDVKTDYRIDTTGIKRASIHYDIQTGSAYILDSLRTTISTPALDSLYRTTLDESEIKSGRQYRTEDFESERNRITSHFRNRGVYNFQPTYIKFDIDTVGIKNHRANVNTIIGDYVYRVGDSTATRPFRIFRISGVHIYSTTPADKTFSKKTDSITYNGFNIYSSGKLRYRPKAITDAVFITPGALFADFRTTLTSRYLSNLRVFNYPTIQYTPDSTGTGLIANIYLVSKEKYTFGAGIDFTHSNIQDFGISGNTSITIRNVFNGAETLEVAARGNIGSSKDFANPDDTFFNVSEYGADVKLTFPRVFLPVNTERIIPKNMIPSTVMSFGIAKQRNIGLDKENFTGAMTYNWTPKRFRTARFDLFNIQYVNNVNIGNYFNVYRSSYEVLNEIAQEYNVNPAWLNSDGNLTIDQGGANLFINQALASPSTLGISNSDFRTITNIEERRKRLTENNLIFASSYSFSKTTKSDLQDNTFHVFRTKLESAGNFLSLLARVSRGLENQSGPNTILDVAYSQYGKGEAEFIKHWQLGRKKVLAIRAFGGLAVPYGNSNSVPFSRSYFAGGSNDNRAWQSYSLGPGRSRTVNDFNEANMKLAFSAEYRFNLFGSFNGALFVDTGNIWNVWDNVTDERAVFDGFDSLSEIAVGSGFGLRYDFNFFVLRLDLGFKTYNPAADNGRWFREYNFGQSVLNIGINYPF